MPSLRKLAIKGTIWTLVGQGGSQVLRLGSNLILTRLLAPDLFGIMALVNVLMVGLNMFSDIGIGPSIIQNDKGDDEEFLNTAWTIQVIRGFVLWLCACIAAWPFSIFYGEPQLALLVPVASLITVISGFNSTGLFTANRHLNLGRLTLIEIGSQVGAIGVMLVWASITPTVWALIAGSLIGRLLKMWASHIWLSYVPNRLAWNQNAVKSLVTFGKWIFLSTVLGFIVSNGDRVILGKFLTLSDLGVYSIAAMIAQFVQQVYSQIGNKILFPIYRNIKYLPNEEIRAKIRKIRLTVISAFLPPLWIFVLFGQEVINIMFDARYQGAGWMLQVLAAGLIPIVVIGIGPFYLALGHSFILMNLVALRAFFLLSAMILGGLHSGANGLILGIAGHNIMVYFADVWVQKKFSIWLPRVDLIGLALSTIVIVVGMWIKKV